MDFNSITSAQYYTDLEGSTNAGVTVVAGGETFLVPLDNANTDYQAVLDWVADGNTIQDAS